MSNAKKSNNECVREITITTNLLLVVAFKNSSDLTAFETAEFIQKYITFWSLVSKFLKHLDFSIGKIDKINLFVF